MLHEFVTVNRDAIIRRAREKVGGRSSSHVSTVESENGLLLVLTQLARMLISDGTSRALSTNGLDDSPRRDVRDSVALAFDVSQIAHAYSDVCQAITEVALEENAPVTVDEFNLLDRCLDHAIADALTEDARLRDRGCVERRLQAPSPTE